MFASLWGSSIEWLWQGLRMCAKHYIGICKQGFLVIESSFVIVI